MVVLATAAAAAASSTGVASAAAAAGPLTSPCDPPRGWWIMMREFGSDLRLPLVPAESRKAPMDAAMPKHTVFTSHGMYCIVSKMASPACTEPPGLQQ